MNVENIASNIAEIRDEHEQNSQEQGMQGLFDSELPPDPNKLK